MELSAQLPSITANFLFSWLVVLTPDKRDSLVVQMVERHLCLIWVSDAVGGLFTLLHEVNDRQVSYSSEMLWSFAATIFLLQQLR